jgi:hypothetical protein
MNTSDSKSWAVPETSNNSFRTSRQTQHQGPSYKATKKPTTKWRPITKPSAPQQAETNTTHQEQLEPEAAEVIHDNLITELEPSQNKTKVNFVWQPDKVVTRRKPMHVALQNGYKTTHTHHGL